MRFWLIAALAVLCAMAAGKKDKKKTPAPPTPLERYVAEANARKAAAPSPSPGAIWSPGSRLADATRDSRASQLDDTVTILVSENASAVASGATQTERASSTANSVTALGGIKNPAGPLANLAGVSGDTKLNGTGTTSRQIVISTTLTARVAAVMPTGDLVLEAVKDIGVNSERQQITVRGVARLADIASDNSIQSDRLAQLEVKVDGKGVVGDAIRRPNLLYRLLLGILPF